MTCLYDHLSGRCPYLVQGETSSGPVLDGFLSGSGFEGRARIVQRCIRAGAICRPGAPYIVGHDSCRALRQRISSNTAQRRTNEIQFLRKGGKVGTWLAVGTGKWRQSDCGRKNHIRSTRVLTDLLQQREEVGGVGWRYMITTDALLVGMFPAMYNEYGSGTKSEDDALKVNTVEVVLGREIENSVCKTCPALWSCDGRRKVNGTAPSA